MGITVCEVHGKTVNLKVMRLSKARATKITTLHVIKEFGSLFCCKGTVFLFVYYLLLLRLQTLRKKCPYSELY